MSEPANCRDAKCDRFAALDLRAGGEPAPPPRTGPAVVRHPRLRARRRGFRGLSHHIIAQYKAWLTRILCLRHQRPLPPVKGRHTRSMRY